MPKSSSDYLQALRQGNYLLFLEWPRFIAVHYMPSSASEGFGAENIVDLLIFEWLNNGFCEEDAQLIALLFKLNQQTPNPLSPDLSYAVVTLSIVVLQCMVYQNTHAHLKCISAAPKSAKEVIALMGANDMEPLLAERALPEQQKKFQQWVDGVSEKAVAKALLPITPILQLRRELLIYVETLEDDDCIRNAASDDSLDISRLCVVRRLLHYLNEQVVLSDNVRQKIKEYVSSIRELSPLPFEERFLTKLSPLSVTDNTWRLIAKVGYFFSALSLPAEKERVVGDTPQLK